jgi:hypothetical protein
VIASRTQLSINAQQIAQGYAEIPVRWAKPLPDKDYTIVFSFIHLETAGGGMSRAYTNNGYRDKEVVGFTAIIGVPTVGAVVGDVIEIDAIVVPDVA